MSCSKWTVVRVLNAAGYHWRPVSKRGKLAEAQLAARKVFVDAHVDKTSSWWREHFGLALVVRSTSSLLNTPGPHIVCSSQVGVVLEGCHKLKFWRVHPSKATGVPQGFHLGILGITPEDHRPPHCV